MVGRIEQAGPSRGIMRLGRSLGCWIELFAEVELCGASRRLYGPADYPGLRVGPDRELNDGPLVAASALVGPGAYVQCFEAGRFEETVFWLLPNQRIHRPDDVTIPTIADSLRLYDRPPFAHEPGYAAYMLWAASQVARAAGVDLVRSGS